MKILLAEDSMDLNRNITYLLRHEKYEVANAFDGGEALALLKETCYDCIILDIMMPKVDGLSALREIRNRHIDTPVLLLTARGEIEDRVAGLDAGADDYLPKPFDARELMARIRTLLRRQLPSQEEEIHLGDIVLNSSELSLSSKSTIHLSITEFELMRVLMSNQDIPLSTGYLLEHIWKTGDHAEEDTVWLYISYLKNKLSMIGSSITITGIKGGEFRLRV